MSLLRRDFWRFAYSVVGGYSSLIESQFKDLRLQLLRGGISVSYKGYAAGMLFLSIVATVFGVAAGAVVGMALRAAAILIAAFSASFGLFGFVAVFGLMYAYPKIKLMSRKRNLDQQLPYVIGHMAVLTEAGIIPEAVYHTIAAEPTDDVVNHEARAIVRDLDILGMDLTQALEDAKLRSPSAEYSDFLDGMIHVSKSGAELKQFLLGYAHNMMEDRKVKAKQFGETIGVIAEMYTILMVVTPLILIIVFSVMGIISGSIGGVSVQLMIQLVAFILTPLGGIFILIIADGAMPEKGLKGPGASKGRRRGRR